MPVQRGHPRRQAEPLKLAPTSCQASSTSAFARSIGRCDIPLHGVAFPFVESAPRAYRLKAGNADPPISTSVDRSCQVLLLAATQSPSITADGRIRRQRTGRLSRSGAMASPVRHNVYPGLEKPGLEKPCSPFSVGAGSKGDVRGRASAALVSASICQYRADAA